MWDTNGTCGGPFDVRCRGCIGQGQKTGNRSSTLNGPAISFHNFYHALWVLMPHGLLLMKSMPSVS
jgi:hypothetical protein